MIGWGRHQSSVLASHCMVFLLNKVLSLRVISPWRLLSRRCMMMNSDLTAGKKAAAVKAVDDFVKVNLQ